MRILYDHQLFSLQNAGGGSRYFYELMKYLGTVPDVQLELLLGMNESVHPLRELGSVTTTVMSFGAGMKPGMLRFLVNEGFSNCVAPFRGKVDVYHTTLYRKVPLVRARQVVATHHDCVQESFPEMFPDAGKIRRAKRRLYSIADAIICVSESSRNDLLSFYPVEPAKTRVIYHGVNQLPRCTEARHRLKAAMRREYLLFVGSRWPYKNFNALLNAFRASGVCHSLDLLVVGGGPLTKSEKELVATLGLDDNIVVFPAVSDCFLGEAYAGAQLFVYPSLYEGFGFPPLEAMAAGCPVLASNTSSIPEVCLDAPLYFNPRDQESFASALAYAVSDSEGREAAVSKGKAVAARYSWNKCGEETLALYRECQ